MGSGSTGLWENTTGENRQTINAWAVLCYLPRTLPLPPIAYAHCQPPSNALSACPQARPRHLATVSSTTSLRPAESPQSWLITSLFSLHRCCLPLHCRGLPLAPWLTHGAFRCEGSSSPGLSSPSPCLTSGRVAEGRRTVHSGPCVHCQLQLVMASGG